ncbi:hypothetical protein GQ42DRAFT_164925 [Ramicandelaber brevisporus]|nr:hypothetical protein GQ42DRAFT_164925 [Ramicandelaber brevisporus]
MASNTTWSFRDVSQGEDAIKLKRYVSMVLDSMRLSIIAARMVEPENTMFTGLEVYRLSDLVCAFFTSITYPQSREERFMIRRFLSYALNAIDTLSKSKDFSRLIEDVLQHYMMNNGYYTSLDLKNYSRRTPVDPMALEWMFNVFMELGYSHLLYLIASCSYNDQKQGLVRTKGLSWRKLLQSKDARRALSRLVETYKELRLSILLDDNGTWWKMLVRDKSKHLLKRLHNLEKESFNTSDILEYARSKEVKGKKEHLIEMLETLEIANK